MKMTNIDKCCYKGLKYFKFMRKRNKTKHFMKKGHSVSLKASFGLSLLKYEVDFPG